jgi:ATP-dependent DNA helicase RecQ
VVETKEKCTAHHLVHILTGAEVKAIKDFGHDKLSVYRKGADLSEKDWESVVRHLLVYDYVKKDIDTYGFIRMQERGHNFLRSPHSLEISKDREYQHDKAESIELEDFKTYDEVLFQKLMKLRKEISIQKKLPPFVIFQEPSIEDMATRMPTTEEEFLNIVGVGKGKFQKFGKPFLELIKNYVKENAIEKEEEEIVIRTNPATKTSNKLFIIQQIDRKIPLENIAKLKSLTYDEVLEDIEQIVNSGTRLNLDYYIKEKVDQDKMQEILDYFMKAQTDSIEEAQKNLADDIEEWEIKLVKMKFLSEVGN